EVALRHRQAAVVRSRTGRDLRADDRRGALRSAERAGDGRGEVRVVVGVCADPTEQTRRAGEGLGARVDVVDTCDQVDALEAGDERVRADRDIGVAGAADVVVVLAFG